MAVADWDGDGDMDVASVRNDAKPQMFVNDGRGFFEDKADVLVPDLMEQSLETPRNGLICIGNRCVFC